MEISFTNCMWAYLLRMPLGFDSARSRLREGMPGTKSTYGHSEFDDVLGEDYYVGLSEKLGDGPPTGSRDITYSAFYPTRVFVWGTDDDDKPADRLQVLKHLKTLGIRSDLAYWNPCRTWRGFESGFKPTFRHALRADANLGLRGYDIMTRLHQPLPAGFELVEDYPERYTVYIDED